MRVLRTVVEWILWPFVIVASELAVWTLGIATALLNCVGRLLRGNIFNDVVIVSLFFLPGMGGFLWWPWTEVEYYFTTATLISLPSLCICRFLDAIGMHSMFLPLYLIGLGVVGVRWGDLDYYLDVSWVVLLPCALLTIAWLFWPCIRPVLDEPIIDGVTGMMITVVFWLLLLLLYILALSIALLIPAYIYDNAGDTVDIALLPCAMIGAALLLFRYIPLA